MEDKNLSENYLNLVTTLTNKFVADLVLHTPKTLRVYPNEELDLKKMAVAESGYSEKLGKRISAHIKLLIQFLMATHHFYEKNFAACISVLSQKCFMSKGKKKETEKLSKGKYKFFYLNAIGCCHFHMDKPSLAIQYFQKATAECDLMQATTKDSKEKPNKKDKPNNSYPPYSNFPLKKISLEENTPSNINFHEIYRQNAASKLPMIIYNIALSFYRKENYTESIRYFLQIGSTQSNNFWYWYRLGVCYYKVYLQKISDKYQSCDNDLYTRSNDFPSPLPNFNASEMKNKARTDSSNSMNYPQPLLPGQEKELGQQKKMDKGPKDGPESDYEFVKENKFKRYHLAGEKSAWSDEDRQILAKNLRNSYK
jgi:tetratricopeptide (TPR) repeat protein